MATNARNVVAARVAGLAENPDARHKRMTQRHAQWR
jgi:hypothetical protein